MSTFDTIVLGFFLFAMVGGVIDLGWFLLTASLTGPRYSAEPESFGLGPSGEYRSRKEAE